MILKKVRSKAPLRIGLAGGGTDLSPYCDEHTGLVLNAAIQKYAHCTLEHNSSGLIEFYSENYSHSTVYPVSKFLQLDGNLDIYKAIHNRICSEFEFQLSGLKVYTYSEAPSGSGLGGSSTLIVSVIKAYCECFNLALGIYDIARLAYTIEREDLAWSGGRQDQYAATFGGFNFMEFTSENRVVVNPLAIKNWVLNELEASSFIAFSGISRVSEKIIDEQIDKLKSRNDNSIETMHELKDDALKMKSAIINGKIHEMAELLNQSWERKKLVSHAVTNTFIDNVINVARDSGALACKVSGAGGGGFIYFMCQAENRYSVMKTITELGLETSLVNFDDKGVQAWTL